MSPKNANAVDDLMHELRNALTIIGGQAQQLSVSSMYFKAQARRMQRAIETFEKQTRKCPYAKEKGAKCGHVM